MPAKDTPASVLGPIGDLWSAVTGQFSLRIALYGLTLVAAGSVIHDGVIAGMLPVWGGGMFLIGLSVFALT